MNGRAKVGIRRAARSLTLATVVSVSTVTATSSAQPVPPPPPPAPSGDAPPPPPPASPGEAAPPAPSAPPGEAAPPAPSANAPSQLPPAPAPPPPSSPRAPAPPHPYPYPPRANQPPPWGYGYAPPGWAYSRPHRRSPTFLPYEEGEPGPPGYYLKLRPRRGLIIAGSVTLGSTWLLTSLAGGVMLEEDDGGEGFAPLFIPVVGPFMSLGTVNPNAFGASVLILDGLAQTAGLAMLVAAFIEPERVWKKKQVALDVTPMKVGDATGIGLLGTW